VFDGSASYSVSSRLKNYRWEIFDTSNNLIETFTQKQIARTFSKPGMYTIKLTVTDEL
jgi:PKD repeat protein